MDRECTLDAAFYFHLLSLGVKPGGRGEARRGTPQKDELREVRSPLPSIPSMEGFYFKLLPFFRNRFQPLST